MSDRAYEMACSLADESAAFFKTLPPSEHSRELSRQIQSADVFFAVTRDGGFWIVKGRARLETIMQSATTARSATGAVFVSCAEEAEAMRLVFGDGAEAPPKSTARTRLFPIKGSKTE